ncbi:MAG: hypothetical protein R3E68_23540, partial [Burkholderiaceae bacterium]
FAGAGIELRHPWTESMQITATGGVQEFGRKWARNDYPLQALFEMGVSLAKVPELDWREAESRTRMALLAEQGVRFVVSRLGVPRDPGALPDATGVSAFELNLTIEGFERDRAAVRALRERSGRAVYLCRIRGGADDTRFDGKHFSHFVKAGFTVDELPAYRDQIAQAVAQGTIDGITIRAEPDADLVTAAEVLGRFCDDTGARLLVSVKLAGNNVAGERTDDGQTVSLAARALLLSRLDDRIQWLFDTFMDVDRGYFPRHAFIDRRFNPRAAAQAWSMIAARFSGATVSRATRSSLALAGHDLVVMVDGKALVLLTGTGQELAERAAGIGRPVDWSADIVQAPNDTLTGRWPQLPAGANGVQAWLAVLTG